jgi:glyoxylase-like metal-dependent hydrolase (beta-lactamase superfamily II)
MRKTILLSILALTVEAFARAQTSSGPATLPFTLKPLGHNAYAAIDDAKGDAGANAGFVIGDNGVLVIDTFENEAAAKQLLAEIRKLTQLPIKFVVNTHYHLDHVAGNKIFSDADADADAGAGAVIVAHQNVPGWIHTENLKFFGKNIKPEEKALVENLTAPNLVYSGSLSISLGNTQVSVAYFPGHTGGDSVVTVYDSKSPVIFCGDLFWNRTLPNLIDASTEPWTKTLTQLSAFAHGLPTTFVPGHGEIGTGEGVTAFQGYLRDLRSMVADALKEGRTGEDLVNSVLPKLTEKYGSWNFFKYFSKSNITDTAAELRGEKKIPQPPPQ